MQRREATAYTNGLSHGRSLLEVTRLVAEDAKEELDSERAASYQVAMKYWTNGYAAGRSNTLQTVKSMVREEFPSIVCKVTERDVRVETLTHQSPTELTNKLDAIHRHTSRGHFAEDEIVEAIAIKADRRAASR